jgi:hypothetical protein
MRLTMRDPMVGLAIGVTAFALAACGSGSRSNVSPSLAAAPSSSGSPPSVGSPSEGAASTPSSAPETDALIGLWRSDPITVADVDAVLRSKFSGSAVDEWERTQTHGCYFKTGQTAVQTLRFAGGQLVISRAINGGVPQEGWTGSYVLKDSDTYRAEDQFADHLYITVDFRIKGDRLFTDLIKDDFPDHSPWSAAIDGRLAATSKIGKPLSETMCGTAIYETTPFTRGG